MDIQQIYTECCDSGCPVVTQRKIWRPRDLGVAVVKETDNTPERVVQEDATTNKNSAECDSKLHCKRLLSHSATKRLINYVAIKNCFSKTLNVATI